MFIRQKTLLIGLLTSLLCFTASFDVQGNSSVAASINGDVITYKEIDKANKIAIYEAEKKLYELRMGKLKEILIPKLIQLDPLSKNMDENEYITQHIVKAADISEEQVLEFAKKQKIPDDKINEELKQRIRQYLNGQKITQRLNIWFNEQIKKHKVTINLAEPDEPMFDVEVGNAPYLGKKNAPITIIEYSDFECPYCARAHDTVKALLKKYDDKILFAYKHFPLDFHPNAQKAAEASLCANEQSSEFFWKLHDEMLADYRNLSLGVIKDKAKAIGLDTEKFSQCLANDQYASQVKADLDEGKSLGVSATPAFFINGVLINGAQPLEVFEEKIEKILAK
ncbi:DsbA family protein [Aliikangiella sp. IMCC44359]|uniref:DsbA family protein n=1 Tax=Aliikangiella sp. IMCC44359 TaxID=3459125 RepID=UPI00403AA239